ncbi:unnamed protein product [Cunninghamella blakesleeana]
MTLTSLITNTTELPISRRKNSNTLSWSSTTSSFSTSSLSTMSTPSTTLTNATLFNPMQSLNNLLPLFDDDLDEDDNDHLNNEHQIKEEDENVENNEVEEEDILHFQQYQKLKKRVTKSLSYAIASQGDAFLVQTILSDDQLRPYLNINDSDDKTLGTTPLIYAACFGYTHIVQLLLDAGAMIDIQDKLGWTPLMWAISNNHHAVVKLLLNQGASSTVKTSIGRSMLDFVDYNNQEVIDILVPHFTKENNNNTTNDIDEQQQGQEFHKRIQQKQHRNTVTTKLNNLRSYYQSIENNNNNNNNNEEDEENDNEEDEEEAIQNDNQNRNEDNDLHDIVLCETSMSSIREFIWDKCLPDQMFVFAEEDITHILQVVILDLQLPMKSRQEIWVPSNVLFLCARYAHYFSSHELLQTLLIQAISCIEDTLQKNKGDIHTLAFWIANLSQLLYYLKKDTGLVVATAIQQLQISELISETYVLLIIDSEKRMDKILESSILDYGSNDSDAIEFADDWQRFFRRRNSSRRQSSLMMTLQSSSSSNISCNNNNNNYNNNNNNIEPSLAQVAQEYQQSDNTVSPFHQYRLSTDTNYSYQPSSPSAKSTFSTTACTLSPHSITSLLSSILYVLQSYEVHPDIIKQAFSQFFHFMSSHLFNQILENKKYICRSKAMDIRMNMCTIENWVRDQQDMFHPLISYFQPLIQLLQLLQCISHIDELETFKNTLTMFELLNPLQMKRCILNYRYEVDEKRLPDDIEKYIIQLAKHTIHHRHSSLQQLIKQSDKKQPSSTSLSRSQSQHQQKPSSSSNNESNAMDDIDESSLPSSPSHTSSKRQSHLSSSSRPTSVSSLGSLIMSKLSNFATTTTDEQDRNNNEEENDLNNEQLSDNENDNDDDDEGIENDPLSMMNHQNEDWMIEEKRDLKYMLPFSLPASSTIIHYQPNSDSPSLTMQRKNSKKILTHQQQQQPYYHQLHEVSEKIYKEVREKLNANENEKIIKERIIIPTIPQEWMDRLDRNESYLLDGQNSSVTNRERNAMEVF